ncbi:MAG: ACT domain-containing protein [Clostridiales bacterium]|nr:ACT domain-containing protein [Clostridiales bacterium]MBQ2816296.1 ACT domain-containing protein [Clostridia bacterium]MBQ4637399.1 ACT domain-containing protein [Clostridia bacterium]
MKAILTVIGHDKVGILAAVTALLAKNNVNILDVSQTIMQNLFTMIMMVDLQDASFETVQDDLSDLADKLGMSIRLQREEVFEAMHRI